MAKITLKKVGKEFQLILDDDCGGTTEIIMVDCAIVKHYESSDVQIMEIAGTQRALSRPED